VGEVRKYSDAAGSQYWRLQSLTNSTFIDQPFGSNGNATRKAESKYKFVFTFPDCTGQTKYMF
jgi:hypothetical protein